MRYVYSNRSLAHVQFLLRLGALAALLAMLAPNAAAQFVTRAGGSEAEPRTIAAGDPFLSAAWTATTTASTSFTYEDLGAVQTLPTAGPGDGVVVLRIQDDGDVDVAFALEATVRIVANGMVPDGSGGVWMTGFFEGTVDFDPGAGTSSETGTGITAYVVQYTSTGALGTVFTVPGGVRGFDLALTPQGELIITGRFAGTADFDPGPGTTSLTSGGEYSMYVARYTTAGALTSAFRVVAPQSFGRVQGVRVASDGTQTVIAGSLAGSADFDPSAGSTVLSTPSGNTHYFVVSYTNANVPNWARSLGGSALLTAVALDAGVVYVGGEFSATLAGVTPSGGSDGFLLSLTSSSGGPQSLLKFGGTFPFNGKDRVEDISVRSNSSVFVAGQFQGTNVDFDPGPGVVTRSAPNSVSYFVLGLTNGVLDFVASRGDANSTGTSLVARVATTASDKPFVAGRFTATQELDPAGGAPVTSAGATDAFYMLLNANGSLPVELTGLDALSDGSDVLLSWQTASETNNAGFAVEHAVLDVAGEWVAGGEWSEVGFVEGAGTVETARAYRFRVSDLPAGTHRFRLKQLDFDGTFEYSPIVEATVVPTGASLAVYPQPAVNGATVVVELPRRQRVTVEVYDLLGRVVETLHAGEAEGALRLDVEAGLPAGVYVVRAAGESLSVSRRMVLAR